MDKIVINVFMIASNWKRIAVARLSDISELMSPPSLILICLTFILLIFINQIFICRIFINKILIRLIFFAVLTKTMKMKMRHLHLDCLRQYSAFFNLIMSLQAYKWFYVRGVGETEHRNLNLSRSCGRTFACQPIENDWIVHWPTQRQINRVLGKGLRYHLTNIAARIWNQQTTERWWLIIIVSELSSHNRPNMFALKGFLLP